jgi:hypothetical protein
MPKRFVRSLYATALLVIAGGIAAAQAPVPQPASAPYPQPVPVPYQQPLVAPSPRPVAPPPVRVPVEAVRRFHVDCVILQVPREVWTKAAAELPREGKGTRPVVVVDEARAEQLVRGMKFEGGADVLAYPALMLADNQTGFFQVPAGNTCPSAMCLRAKPWLAANGHVQLLVEYQHTGTSPTRVEFGDGQTAPAFNTQAFQSVVSLPDGSTAVCEGPFVVSPGGPEKAQHAVVLMLKARVADPAAIHADGKLVTKTFAVADLVVPFNPGPGEMPPLGMLHPAAPPRAALPNPPMMPVTQASGPVPAFTLAASPIHPAGYAVAPPALPVPLTATPDEVRNGQALCHLIRNTVHPYSWAETGGAGRIEFNPQAHALVVSQSPAVVAEVASFVDSVRKFQDKSTGCQVALEFRVVELPTCERIGVDFNGDEKTVAATVASAELVRRMREKPSVAFLTEAQAAALLESALLESAGAGSDGRVVTAPKFTCFDGQRCVVHVGQTQVFQTGLELTAGPGGVARTPKFEAVDLGMRLVARPTVSANRRFVRVEMKYETAELDPTVPVHPVVAGDGRPPEDFLCQPSIRAGAVCETVAVPVGRTAVIPGPRIVREVRIESGPPVLSRIPYMSRLFRTVGSGQMEVRQMLLVTPRLIETGEPQVVTPAAAKPECVECCKAAHPKAAELVAAYRKACAEGRTEAATALAVQALAIDPTCFAGK